MLAKEFALIHCSGHNSSHVLDPVLVSNLNISTDLADMVQALLTPDSIQNWSLITK